MSNSKPYISHQPVLKEEVVAELITDPEGIYIDATLGGGGHAEAILQNLSDTAQLLGIDQDDEALDAAQQRLSDQARFTAIKGNFGYLSTLIPPELHRNITGILLDLGVSTHQISAPDRGFSYQEEGPLDMRMGNLIGTSARDVVNGYSYKELRDVIFHLGEEKRSREIARAIVDNRPVETTAELADIVQDVARGDQQVKSTARVFQAIRIEVNQELKMLCNALEQSLELLKIDGRIVAISYHSLEDRIVKYFFRSGNHQGKVPKDFYGHSVSPLEPVYKDIIQPTEEEQKANPASRSAKLRVAEKVRNPEEAQ